MSSTAPATAARRARLGLQRAAACARRHFQTLLPQGGILAIDLETVSVILFAFPTLLILWKSIGDDGSVNRLETVIRRTRRSSDSKGFMKITWEMSRMLVL